MAHTASGGSITLGAGGILIAAAWILGRQHHAASLAPVLAALPFVIGVLAVLLAARFRKSRLAGAPALVAGVAWSLGHNGGAAGLDGNPGLALLLLPLGLAFLALLDDHSVFSWGGLLQLSPVILLVLGSWVAGVVPVSRWVGVRAIPVQLGWMVILAAAVLCLLSLLFRKGVVDAAFLPALGAVAVTFGQVHGRSSGIPGLTAAQAIFLVAGAEEAYRLAFHDELTGLPGRRALDEALRRLRGGFSIAMVDIDHFKRFNDRFGHDAGDQVLRMVARELARVPAGGRPYRYGGEEFVLLFPGLARAEAVTATEAVREAIARRTFHLRSPGRPKKKPKSPKSSRKRSGVTISVSAGVASTTSRRTGPLEVLKAADSALYRAKARGRNRVEAS